MFEQRRRGRPRPAQHPRRPTRCCRCVPPSSPHAPTCPSRPTTLANLAGTGPDPARAVARDRPRPLRRPARHRPRADRRLGGPGPGRHHRPLAARVGGGALPAAAQRGAPPHRRPAPHRDRRARRRPGAQRHPRRPAAARRAAARHRQGPRRPRPLGHRRAARHGRSPPGWGYPAADVEVVTTLVREHLTLIDLATRRDHQDAGTVTAARAAVGGVARGVRPAASRSPRPTPAPPGRRPGPTGGRPCSTSSPTRRPARAGEEGAVPPPAEADPTSSTSRRRLSRRAPRASPGSIIRPQGGSLPHRRLRPRPAGTVRRHRRAARGIRAASSAPRSCAPIDGVAANEWHVESPSGEPPDEERIVRGLSRLGAAATAPRSALLDRRRRTFAARPSAESATGSPGQARALVVPHASEEATVHRGARPGPARPAPRARAWRSPRRGLSVRSAHIATYAGQTLDTFYVTEFGGRLLPPARVAQTVAMVIDTCDGADPRPQQSAVDPRRRIRPVEGTCAPASPLAPRQARRPGGRLDLGRVFNLLSDRLTATFKNLRGKGRLSESDVNATIRDIRLALLDADVVAAGRQGVHLTRCASVPSGPRSSGALNPAQQVVKIVNEELVDILGGETADDPVRQEPADRDHAGRPPGLGQDDPGRQARPLAQGARATPRCSSPPTSSAPTP